MDEQDRTQASTKRRRSQQTSIQKGIQKGIQLAASQRPANGDKEAWRAYWKAQGQPWRTEPEIDIKHQQDLEKHLATIPIEREEDLLFFENIQLNRADMEWLLATQKRPERIVFFNKDNQQRQRRESLTLCGADLRKVNLSDLPMERVNLLEAHLEGANLVGAHLEEALLIRAHLEGADLSGVHLERAYLGEAHLEGVPIFKAHLENALLNNAHLGKTNLFMTHLEGAYLPGAHLEGADLRNTHLEGARLMEAHLEGADLEYAHLESADLNEAHLEGAKCCRVFFDAATRLNSVTLSDEKHGSASLAEVSWGNVNLSVLKWSHITMLGDECEAQQKKRDGKKKERDVQLGEYEQAVRANRQLAVALEAQGLNEIAARFAYRAQVLQKSALKLQMLQRGVTFRQRIQALRAWLFSWFLFLLAGYGYKPGRSFLAYLLVIGIFAALYYHLSVRLAWNEAIVISMTAFHGRGFFPDQFKPGDSQALVAAIEAFVGLLIEVTFIATLTQRLFRK